MALLGVTFPDSSSYAVEPASDTIQLSKVIAEKGIAVCRRDTLNTDGVTNVSDALDRIPGLLVNDFGGAASLKTVSLRGMGSSQTAIYLDGVRIGNLMAGQADLGMIGLGNLASAAVDYAQNGIFFTTARPEFMLEKDGSYKRISGRVALNGGSFGTFLPSVLMSYRASDELCLSAYAEGVASKGNYHYLTRDENGNPVSAKRADNGMKQIRGGLDLFGRLDGGSWRMKAYVNGSKRHSPGSVTFPYPAEQKDVNAFLQASVQNRFSTLYTLVANAKVAHDNMQYSDSWSSAEYNQSEVQVNTSNLFEINEWCSASVAVGLVWDGLSSGNYVLLSSDMSPALVSRLGITASAAASFEYRWFKADLTLEYCGAMDFGFRSDGSGFSDRHNVSPSIDLRFDIAKGIAITAFGRRAYRNPTFNELYYAGFGNPELRPEDGWLTDVGVEWNHATGKGWSLQAKIDGFFNRLTDRILSAPSEEDPNIWYPYNVGVVRSLGADVLLGARYARGEWTADLEARYSYLDAEDRTPGGYSFGSQLPYTSRHSLVLTGGVGYKGWGLDAVWNVREGRVDSYQDMPGWNTLDVKALKRLTLRAEDSGYESCSIEFSLTGKNVTDFRYELSTGYPMPGWALYGGITIIF